jgi:hypothetical protein
LIAGPAVAAPAVLRLDAATQTRLQIRTAPVQAAQSADAVNGFATVMDPAALLQLLSDIDAAKAALAASSPEAARTQTLAKDATVSSKAAEAARAQAQADQAKLNLLRQRLGLEWGPYFAGLSDAALTQLAHDIAAQQTALVRIDTPSGQGLKTATTANLDLGPLGTAQARVVGVARTADQRLQSPGLITVVTGSQAAYLSNGLTMNAKLYSGGTAGGVLVPNAALLRQNGQVYAYVRVAPTSFVKRTVIRTKVTPEGLIVQDGFKPGEAVVVQGASALLAAETPKAATGDGD